MNAALYGYAIPAAVAAFGVVCTAFDISRRRIPNIVTFPTMMLGLVLHAMCGGWKDLASSFAALVLCGVAFLIVYLAGGMGAGDVKMIAAEGCLLGLSNAGTLLALTTICGGVLALCMAVRYGRLRQTLANMMALSSHHVRNGLTPHPDINVLNQQTLRLPYALAITAGSMFTLCVNTPRVTG